MSEGKTECFCLTLWRLVDPHLWIIGGLSAKIDSHRAEKKKKQAGGSRRQTQPPEGKEAARGKHRNRNQR